MKKAIVPLILIGALLGGGWFLIGDRFQDATREECTDAVNHIGDVLAGGPTGNIAAFFLKGEIGVCVAHASKHDYKCIMAASSKAELEEW